MDNRRARFPIFRQLSCDTPSISAVLQVVCATPAQLGPELGQFGEILKVQIHLSSIVVQYESRSSAEAAYSALSRRFRVFYCSPFENSFHEKTLSLDVGAVGATLDTQSSSREEDERRPKKRPVSGAERQDYAIDVGTVAAGLDLRTTVMIKNIPNKYTQKMLLRTIDEHLSGEYDFLYLPIDFKNRCNVGYAFLNLTHPRSILNLYELLNGKKWERFNSDKVCELAYARIQGKEALVQHIQSSSVMSKGNSKVRPLIL